MVLLRLLFLLCGVALSGLSSAASLDLAWDASPSPEATGYFIAYGTASGNYPNKVNVGATRTYTAAGLQDGTTYHFAASAYDANGTESAYSNELVVTTPGAPPPPPPVCPCSVFTTQTPSTPNAYDPSSVELGMKFTSDVAGFVSGVKFYKGSQNTGKHVASLWSASGTLLARATFTAETYSGWQTVYFATKVAIQAGTTYVVSYHVNSKYYAYSPSYFTASVNSPPLHAPVSAGVYRYASTPRFPSATYYAANYWVDVVFVPTN